jgi:signal transduction histidine kinase
MNYPPKKSIKMTKSIRVLIIEDNDDDTILEIQELVNGGYEVIFERVDTKKALEEALTHKIWNCIISDYSMPQFSGLDALSELKKTGIDIPFILVSGAMGEETAVEAMKAGAHDYIMKNNLQRLVPAVERELRDAEIRRQKILAIMALEESEQLLKKQNLEYQKLNTEYISLNEELSESLVQIQKMNADLIIAKNRAEESERLKSSFLSNMSHEIRTPLNAILGFSKFLKEPGLPEDKINSFVDIIDSSGQQLLTIIDDIIDISKIEADLIRISSGPVNINGLLAEIFQQFKKQCESKGLNLYYTDEYKDGTITVQTDEMRIRQILCNLLGNAVKFTQKGKIEFGYLVKENRIAFYVKDTGIGIAPEDQLLIFKPFRQVETTTIRNFGGNGLGLSISKALVEKLGGTISLESAAGQGSTFTFDIPYINRPGTNSLSRLITDKGKNQNWVKKTILIVEDELFNYNYFQEVLSSTNVQILHAWDGKEAVEFVKKLSNISLVLMDIKMPVMDGYTATRLIKELRPQLPVIAQTAFAFSEDRKKALNAGCDNYFSKPIKKEAFIDVISNYLN